MYQSFQESKYKFWIDNDFGKAIAAYGNAIIAAKTVTQIESASDGINKMSLIKALNKWKSDGRIRYKDAKAARLKFLAQPVKRLYNRGDVVRYVGDDWPQLQDVAFRVIGHAEFDAGLVDLYDKDGIVYPLMPVRFIRMADGTGAEVGEDDAVGDEVEVKSNCVEDVAASDDQSVGSAGREKLLKFFSEKQLAGLTEQGISLAEVLGNLPKDPGQLSSETCTQMRN